MVGVISSFGFFLYDHRRRELLQRRFGGLTLGYRRNLPRAAATAAACRFLRRRDVGLDVRIQQVKIFRKLLLHRLDS